MPLGKPLFNYDDDVCFEIDFGNGPETVYGKVYIIDAYGTFEQDEEASYDIMVENHPAFDGGCLVKHVRESQVSPA